MRNDFDLHLGESGERSCSGKGRRRLIKRSIALILAAVLTAGSCLPAMAAEQTEIQNEEAAEASSKEMEQAVEAQLDEETVEEAAEEETDLVDSDAAEALNEEDADGDKAIEEEETANTAEADTAEEPVPGEEEPMAANEETEVEVVPETEVIQDSNEAYASDAAGSENSYGSESGDPGDIIKCTVSYDPNGGEFYVARYTEGPLYGEIIGFPTETPEDPKAILTITVEYPAGSQGAYFGAPNVKKKGYKLAGWSLTKDGEAEDLYHELKITEDITVYAVWTNDDNSGTCGDNATWALTTVDDKLVLTISGSGEMYNYRYREELPWRDFEDIDEVVIEDGITHIGSNAFNGCDLKNVTIPDSVTSIGSNAFYNCRNMSDITIPDSVTSIGGGAFEKCSGLTSITIPDNVTIIEISTFQNCENLTSVELPEGITRINAYAFDGCSALQSITIPDSVTSMELAVFSSCTSLKEIIIPEKVTSIGSYSFALCSGLTSITIPEGVTGIGSGAFSVCNSLSSILIPKSVTSFESVSGGPGSGSDPVSAFSNYNGVILVYSGSPAEAYCEEKGLNYRVVDESQGNESGDPSGNESGDPHGNESGDPYATEGKCGDNATWALTTEDGDSYTLTISGSGDMYDYRQSENPWRNYASAISEVVFDGEITSLHASHKS